MFLVLYFIFYKTRFYHNFFCKPIKNIGISSFILEYKYGKLNGNTIALILNNEKKKDFLAICQNKIRK